MSFILLCFFLKCLKCCFFCFNKKINILVLFCFFKGVLEDFVFYIYFFGNEEFLFI